MTRNKICVLILILAALVLTRNIIIHVGLEQGMRVMTGLRLDIEKLDIGLLTPVINIENLKLFNPAGYPDPVMAEIGGIHLRYKLWDMLKGQIYLKDFSFTLKQLFIIRRTGNQLNIDSLKTFQSHGAAGSGPALKLTVDDLNLNIGKVVYKDYSHFSHPVVKTYDLNLNEHYKGIHGIDDLERLVMVGVLNKTSIASLIRVNLAKLKEGLSSTLLKSLQVSDNFLNNL